MLYATGPFCGCPNLISGYVVVREQHVVFCIGIGRSLWLWGGGGLKRMLNNSQYTIIIQYISILGVGGGFVGASAPLHPGSYAYVICIYCFL